MTCVGGLKCSAFALAFAASVLGGGCAANKPQTSRYKASDIDFTSVEIVQKWAESDFMKNRTPDSPRIRLMPSEMENRSSDRLSRVDQRAAVAKVVNDPGIQQLLRDKAIDVLWSMEEVALLKRHGIAVPALEPGDQPTHVFRAEFASIPRAAAAKEGEKANERIDRFFVTYSIVEIPSRRIDWSDTIEFARAAHGVLAD